MAFRNLTGKHEAAFLAALRAGQYNLLLGAGFSMDSTNGRGGIPSGKDLSNELEKITGASGTLQRVYSLINKNPKLIKEHITDRFSDCVPGPTAKLMSSFVWKRVFTWNIDDVIENIYAEGKIQNIVSKHFNDVYSESSGLEELYVIHLHGYVKQPEKGYVFSREQYVKQIMMVNPWMTVLSQFMLSEPMIIAGSSLDEVDLDFYLAQRTAESARDDRGPSILVASDDAIARNICETHNLLHFVGYSHDFFEYCKSVLPSAPTPMELVPQETRNLLPAGISKSTVMAFNSDFELVPGTAPPSEYSRFMYGHHPSWQDLQSGMDVSRPIVADIMVEVEARLADPQKSRVLLISENAGTGKSTVIRRTAFELAKRGIRTLMCSALSRIGNTTASVIDMIDDPVVIVIDNFAEQVTAIPELLARLEKTDVVILGCERAYRLNYLKQVMAGISYDFLGKLPMTQVESKRLIEKYFQAGAISDHDILKYPDNFVKKIVGDPIAVACCRILNDFRPMEHIVADVSNDASKEELDRYLAAAIAQHCFVGGLRYEILVSAFSSIGIHKQMERTNPLPLDYYDSANAFVVPENATLAERVLDLTSKIDPNRLLRIFVGLAIEIRPRVNRMTIRARAPEARLSGRLFDYDDVVKKFLGVNAEHFYAQTKDSWQWNSRYWEQVALLKISKYEESGATEAGLAYLDDAVRHARHAVAIELHPFGLTTLGKVLLVRMTAPGANLQDSFDEAFIKLSQAVAMEARRERVAAPPFALLFTGTLRLMDNGGGLSAKQRDSLTLLLVTATQKLSRDPEMQELIGTVRTAIATAQIRKAE